MTQRAQPGPTDPITDPLPSAAPLGDVPGHVHRAVPYAVRQGYRPLQLDLYLPHDRSRPAPVVLFLHGGGWRLGSRSMFCPTWSDWRPSPFQRLVAEGFAVASIDYRLSGEATFPAQLEDCSAALAWLTTRGDEAGADPTRLVVWGESAGGHLAALLGLTAPESHRGQVSGVVDWYGPADLNTLHSQAGADPEDLDTREARLLGAPPAQAPELARVASPLTYVRPGAPPFHIAHGLADRFVPVEQSRQLAKALEAAGVATELELVPGADHMWREAPDPEAIFRRAVDFVRRVTG